MNKLRKLSLLLFLCSSFIVAHAQNINWMIGTWNGSGSISGNNKSRLIKTIVIDAVSGENFSGTKTSELTDRSHAKIIASISGYLNQKQVSIQTGVVLFKKDPSNGHWWDCSSCTPENKITVRQNTVTLSIHISGCQENCDGVSIYSRDLCDYDSATQQYLVNLFGEPADIAAFKPCVKKPPEIIAKTNDDSIKNAALLAKKRQKQIDDSLTNVANIAKQKEQQRIQDSIKTATTNAKKRQQQINDSTKNAIAIAKQRQQQIDDSISLAKKQQQQINDSLINVVNIAKQKEQQRIQDSIKTVAANAKKRQQEINDSTKNAIAFAKQRQQHIDDSIALAKKRQEQIDDSLANIANIAKQKELQHIQDSLKTVAANAKKRQQQIDDSTKNAIAFAKQRQQHIDDSIALAKKRQEQIDDSLANIANIAKQKELQHIQDSLKTVAANAKKRQQQIDDSTKNATAFAKKRQKEIDDSTKTAAIVAKQRQQQIEDSLNNATAITKQKRQQQIDDSIKNALNIAQKKLTPKDSAAIADKSKLLQTRDNVLLQSYHITTPDILIELFDNAQIDGDRVSVYHNNVLIVNNQTLLREPITFKIHADANSRTHEFILIAENLGTIPPNTALMRITVGTQVYKLSVKTDLKTNAKIDFTYDGN